MTGVDIDRIHHKRIKKILSPSEHHIQSAYFSWVRLRYPGCKLIYAVPNSSKLTDAGRVYKWQEGLTAGIPDVNIDISCGGYHGARIEFKRHDGRVTDEQLEAQRQLKDAGYWVIECRSTEEAIDATTSYLRSWQWGQ